MRIAAIQVVEVGMTQLCEPSIETTDLVNSASTEQLYMHQLASAEMFRESFQDYQLPDTASDLSPL